MRQAAPPPASEGRSPKPKLCVALQPKGATVATFHVIEVQSKNVTKIHGTGSLYALVLRMMAPAGTIGCPPGAAMSTDTFRFGAS